MKSYEQRKAKINLSYLLQPDHLTQDDSIETVIKSDQIRCDMDAPACVIYSW